MGCPYRVRRVRERRRPCSRWPVRPCMSRSSHRSRKWNHAAARPLPDRPHRQNNHGRQVAGTGSPRLQRACRCRRGDHRPAPGGGADPPVRRAVGGARRRARVRDQGHLRADDALVLLAPRIPHRRPARPRGAVRATVWPQTIAARAGAACASVKLHYAQGEGRRAGLCAAAQGMGGQARTHGARGRAHTRPGSAGAGPRRAEGRRAGPAGKEHLDPRRPDQVPGPRAAQDRHGAGRGPRPCSRTWPTARCVRSSSR
jgi:hypothetical protein